MKCELSNRYVKVYIFALLSVLLLVAPTQSAQALTSGDYTYEITDNQATITRYTGAGGDVVVPSALDGYPVIAIGDFAFTSSTSLTSIIIPESITSIGNDVFNGCRYLTAITVDMANPNYSSIDGVLFDKAGTTLVRYPRNLGTSYIIPSNVTTIGYGAFKFCSLASVTIPESVTSIGDYAFNGIYPLTGVSIPHSVTSIGNYAFGQCLSLTDVTISDGVASIGNNAFERCRSLTNITIPNGVTIIGAGAFYNCYQLASVNLPDSVTSIGSGAFALCDSLTSITIPNSVTTISNLLFDTCRSLTSINIPDSVTSINAGAFSNCLSLTAVDIPNSVTSIGDGAFNNCSQLISITIPSSVISIGKNALFCGSSLTEINVDTANPSYCDIDGVLFDKEGAILLQYPDGKPGTSYTIPSNVITIGENAFSYCNLISITIPDSVTRFEPYAFSSCSLLTDITIPDGLISIGDNAFNACSSLTSISIPDGVTSIGNWAFYACRSLGDITFYGITPPSTGSSWIVFTKSTLQGHAYCASSFPAPGSSFNGLTMGAYIPEDYDYTITGGEAVITGYNGDGGDVTIPPTLHGFPVTGIGDNAFDEGEGSFSLTGITIPGSVTSIGSSAFAGCYNLNDITFLSLAPPTIADNSTWLPKIGPALVGHAYYGSSFPAPGSSFNGLTMGDYIPENYYYTLTNGKATITRCLRVGTGVTVPATLGGCPVVAIGDRAFSRLPLTSVTIPSGVTSIGNYAFQGCSSLTSITIPSSVTSIGNDAFSSCRALTNITIPNSVTTISNGLFTDCWSLTGITIPSGVTSIGNGTFLGCSALTSITIPDSVTSIGANAFEGCSSLASITIPSGVTSIPDSTFLRCSSLSEINVDTANPNYRSIGGILFDKTGTTLVQYPMGKQGTVYAIPANVTAIGRGAFAYCSALASMVIPDSVTSIGDYAFYACGSLTSITIPGGVTSIGNSLFKECSSLTGVTIPSGVNSIGDYAFADCTSLTGVIIPGSVTSIGGYAFAWCSSLSDITFQGLTPPTIADSSTWLSDTPPGLLGHAYFGSHFPASGSSFTGLNMGSYIAPPITGVSPSSPLTLYTKGTAVTQTFAASYHNNGLVTSATLAIDTGAPLNLGTSSFSSTVSLALGSHTITLTINNAEGGKAIQTWSVTVVQDKTAPVISGIVNKMKIASGSSVTINFIDTQSGVNKDSLKVYIDNKDVTSKITITANGFTIPSNLLSKGGHSIKLSLSDNVGNIAKTKYDISVK